MKRMIAAVALAMLAGCAAPPVYVLPQESAEPKAKPRTAKDATARVRVGVLPFDDQTTINMRPNLGQRAGEHVLNVLFASNRLNVAEASAIKKLLDEMRLGPNDSPDPSRVGRTFGLKYVVGGEVLSLVTTTSRPEGAGVEFTTKKVEATVLLRVHETDTGKLLWLRDTKVTASGSGSDPASMAVELRALKAAALVLADLWLDETDP